MSHADAKGGTTMMGRRLSAGQISLLWEVIDAAWTGTCSEAEAAYVVRELWWLLTEETRQELLPMLSE